VTREPEHEFKHALLALERERERGHDYLSYHRRRFQHVLDVCLRVVPDAGASVLDVGPSQLSRMLADRYAHVVTLGFTSGQWGHERIQGGREPDGHIEFDLNDSVRVARVSDPRRFDLVVFAETLEHLHAAPELVLRLLRELMKPHGVLVCQTPNAAALHKRVKLALGAHPYERIRIDERNPGHFREYTKAELLAIARVAGFAPLAHEYRDYFGRPDGGGPLTALAFALYRVVAAVVPSFRRGQTLVLRRDDPREREAAETAG
jgi:2-polyprenyl-3-methyl-5-hydroxy-6-metoxy-1,4-benzoquinol methylase